MILFEAAVAKQTLQNKEFSHISDVYLYFSSFTAHCESSFSAWSELKTYLTSIMGEQRLSDLAILSVKRELSGTLDISQVCLPIKMP